jgi:hypothetical protein
VYWQLVEMAIAAMSPGDFEDLVFALVRREDDRARQLGPPDAGRDTIVPCGDGTELVWQAKHHTAGIDWGKCEESLTTALRERRPREVTFVFPVKLTATKEPGLADLRERYRQVIICEPWTLPDLRAKLAEAHPSAASSSTARSVSTNSTSGRCSIERPDAMRRSKRRPPRP